MDPELRSLIALTIGCTLAGAIFGFGSAVFSFRSAYEELGRETLIQFTSTIVYLALALILVFKGGWRGVLASVAMVVGATAIVWALLPAALSWAAVSDPAGYGKRFGSFSRPSYVDWALYDVLGISIAAAFAQGLKMMARVDPTGPRDE